MYTYTHVHTRTCMRTYIQTYIRTGTCSFAAWRIQTMPNAGAATFKAYYRNDAHYIEYSMPPPPHISPPPPTPSPSAIIDRSIRIRVKQKPARMQRISHTGNRKQNRRYTSGGVYVPCMPGESYRRRLGSLQLWWSLCALCILACQ